MAFTKDEKNIIMLARKYSTMVTRRRGRHYSAFGRNDADPRESKNWSCFEALYGVLNYMGIWAEHEVFLAAQFECLSERFKYPYPNMLYGYTARNKYESYAEKRKRRVPESVFNQVRAVGDKEIILAFTQSARNYRMYRSHGFTNLEAYKLYPEQFTVYFIATDPEVRLRLEADSDTARFSPTIKEFFKRLKNMRVLRAKLDALWQKLVVRPLGKSV